MNQKAGPGPKQGLTDHDLTAQHPNQNKAHDEGDRDTKDTKRPVGRLAWALSPGQASEDS